ncbi:MAG: aminotransferase class I/II-fold pyridoxal phosphate-dependent enzyme [Candidatus Tritonobacter lacicola]|nr:aminotransferase class I/II-fold pyridoxal phosphate-dependent enzyme [Candidatus Tritonobacter lacicola]
MDSDKYTLIDFFESPDKDLFSKTRDFYEFYTDVVSKGYYLYEQEILGKVGPRVRVMDKATGKEREMIMMASNNYLGLTDHPRVIEAMIKGVEEYGTGAGSALLLAGTTRAHKALEERIAAFHGREKAAIFSSGYLANLGAISGLIRSEDIVINDRFNHASIIDGCKLSGGKCRTYKHVDMSDLKSVLLRSVNRYKGIFIVTDGVFSMDGDVAPLGEITDLARKFNAKLLVDEAHAVGVVGPTGRGTVEMFGVKDKVDLVVGTLSKASGGVGGYITGTREVIRYIRHYARSFIFTAAPSPAICAALKVAFDVIDEEPQLRQRLWDNLRYMSDRLKRAGFSANGPYSGIIPIIIGDEVKMRKMSRDVHQRGLFISAIVYPVVPKNLARFRLSLMATHTKEDLDEALSILIEAGKKYEVI